MVIGEDLVVMRPRIAQALGIRNGQTEMVHSRGVSLRAPVKIKDGMCSDILIHDLMHLFQAQLFARLFSIGDIVRCHVGKGFKSKC